MKTELEWRDSDKEQPKNYSQHGNTFLSETVLVLCDGEVGVDVYYRIYNYTENGAKLSHEGWNSEDRIEKWAYINKPK